MVNNLFSPKAMEALSDIVLKVVQNALRKAREAHDNNTPLDIQRLYTGVTVCINPLPRSLLSVVTHPYSLQIDTIMQVLCDKQLNLIDSDEKEPAFLATLRTFSENFFVLKHFPFLNTIAQTLPASIVERIIPGEFEFRKVTTPGCWIPLKKQMLMVHFVSENQWLDHGQSQRTQDWRNPSRGWPCNGDRPSFAPGR